MNPEEAPVSQIPPVAPVSPTGQLPVAIPTSEIQSEIPPTPEMPKSNKKMFLVFGTILLLVVLFAMGVFAFTAMQKPEDKTTVEPTPSPESVIKKESTDTDEDALVNQRTQQMRENINAAKVYIEKHQDLEKELAALNIIYAKELKSRNSTIKGWLIQARDESKSNPTQADYPQYIYLVTEDSWKMIDGPLPVECEILNLATVWEGDQVVGIIVDTGCSMTPNVKLFSLPSGEQISLSDPDGLSPENGFSVINEDGGTSGTLMIPMPHDGLFEVLYSGGVYLGRGVFSAKTGHLLDLVIYSELVD